jgi:hypothetical protein
MGKAKPTQLLCCPLMTGWLGDALMAGMPAPGRVHTTGHTPGPGFRLSVLHIEQFSAPLQIRSPGEASPHSQALRAGI